MRKQYQISERRAAEKFQNWAATNTVPIQLTFPTAGIVELAQQSLGDLIRAVGKTFIETVMEAEVQGLVGQRSQPNFNREAYRWGTESGYCIVDGQRVPIDRPRVRSREHNKEIPLGSYEMFQKSSLIEETVWQKIMHGLTMRSYKEVIQQFADAYGIEKSTTSEHFIQASRAKLEQLMKRSLANLSLIAILIDGTIFKGQHLIVAIGLDRFGTKVVLGLRQGATENATVVEGLLGELAERGINFQVPRLYLVDGSKAIRRGSQPMSVGRQNSYFCALRFGGCGAAGKTPRTARGLLPSTISTLPWGLNLVTIFEPSSTVQILSSLSTRTEWANSKPRNPLPISLMNVPV